VESNRLLYLETHLEIIRYFSKSIFRQNTVDDILWDITSNCIHRLDFVDCVIYLIDEESNVLVQKAAYGAKDISGVEVAAPIDIPLGQGIVGSVAESGEAEIIPDCSQDKRYIVDDAARLSELCVPIMYEGKPIGAIDSEHHEKNFFSQEHLDIVSSIANISATKIVKTIIEEKNEILARFVEENPSPVLRVDKNGLILNKNRAADSLLHFWQVDEDLISNSQVLTAINKCLVTESPTLVEANYDDHSTSLLFAPVTDRDYVNIFASDVTELRRAKDDAERANRAKDQFLSIMSHEIRTPLNAVIGITELLKNTDPSPSQLQYLKSLDFSGKNLLCLINDILDLEKIEAGKIVFEEHAFDVREVIYGIHAAHGHLAKQENVKILCNIETEIPQEVVGDQNRLIQIINNLLSNAIKFSPGGTVKLGVEMDMKSGENVSLKFSVKDDGIGIPREKIHRIFNAFEQANTSTTREHGGTGLGLTITKKLVELQGGMMLVESEVGHGSKFGVQLSFGRIIKSEKSESLGFTFDTAQLANTNILLVDDNPINLMVAEQLLLKWGVEVTKAANGQLAIDEFQERRPDLILMDLQMPVLDGIEATKEIRKQENGTRVPIIAMTADAMLKSRDEAFEAGMNDYITKPFNPEELLKKIKKNLTA
jgi:signal transduction histidine kinase/CheY-like chemotaxis protein